MSIQENLDQLGEQEIQERNLINHFLPFRQQRNKPVEYDFDAIAGEVIASALNVRIKPKYDLKSFTEDCLARLKRKLSDNSMDDLIRQMYFSGDSLYMVSPEFLLFRAADSESGGNKHISRLFRSFLATSNHAFGSLTSEVNFLEAELVAELQSNFAIYEPNAHEVPYLPFLANSFATDLRFLCQHPNYLLQNIRSFLGLYTFLYSAQLALNINSWEALPVSKPLYFILDTEKASIERRHVRDSFPWLRDKVGDLFPVLSMLEYFNQPQSKVAKRYPLWKYVEHIDELEVSEQANALSGMKSFAENYREKRGLKSPGAYPSSSHAMVKALTDLSKEVFSKRESSQHTVNGRFVKAFENDIAQHFIQARGRSGRVLILNQDYLLLLTNLAVGEQEQLQFQRLLGEFKERGIWFDRQSEQALINFYERVGNVERMSDSGDAVYVRKTL